MKIKIYDYVFDIIVDPLYSLNEDYSIEIILFELSENGYKQHTMQSSNQHYFTKNFNVQPRYKGTFKEMSIKEVAIELLQYRYDKYLKKGYTQDLVALELECIKKIKGKLTDRYNYLKNFRKKSLTRMPKKFIWHTYEKTISPIKITYYD